MVIDTKSGSSSCFSSSLYFILSYFFLNVDSIRGILLTHDNEEFPHGLSSSFIMIYEITHLTGNESQ